MSDVGRETGKCVPLNVQHSLNALARRQYGPFALAQLLDLGLTPSGVRKRVASGRLHRIHRAVYALVPSELLGRDGRFMAAVLACGPGAALSHRSAAALHELRATERAGVDVTVPSRSPRKHPGIDVHRSTTLAEADTTHVNGIRCTTIARTQIDLADVVNDRAVERAYDQAEILEAFDLRALEDQLARNRCRRATPRVRAILERHRVGATATWSELEERLLALCRASGLADPEANAWIAPDDGEPAIHVDFLWRAEPRLVVETDGRRYHATRRAFESDRRRDQRLTLAGWRVVRITWRQLIQAPEQVTTMLRALLEL